MSRLSACYSALFAALNAEVQIRWLQLVVRSLFYPELPRVRDFLHKHTSRMYTVPLYEDMASGAMRSNADEYFSQSQRRLHPNLRRSLQALLLPSQSAAGGQEANQSAADGGEANQSAAEGGENEQEANHNSPITVSKNCGDWGQETNQNGGTMVIQNGGQANQNVWSAVTANQSAAGGGALVQTVNQSSETQNGGKLKLNGAATNQDTEAQNGTANHRAACYSSSNHVSPETRPNQNAAFST
ncbi:hypothetical protein NQD34_010028 [Periophthalmus magnuspinnatus]|nr:hypothetical protein NQD34_010028 [Periophthalmus magnuspinnatus]